MLYSAYIWDFDGTLFDSYPHVIAAFEKVLARHGIPYDHKTVTEKLYIHFDVAAKEYNLTKAQFEEFSDLAFQIAYRPFVTVYPGAAAVLRAITENGGKNYLYTHRDHSAGAYLRLFGLDKYFSGIVDSTIPFPAKPAPDAIEFITSRYGLDKSQTLMVGDREIDVLAGVNAGCDGCLFVTHPVDAGTTVAKYTVHSLPELAEACGIPLSSSDLLTAEDAAALRAQASAAALALCEEAHLTAGQRVVIGCSTSEITGERIGSSSTPEAADAVFGGLYEVFSARGIYIAAQCCEHLNRALIIDRAAWQGEEIVNVVPMPKAGGSFAVAAYAGFADPVAVAEIRADAGLDIGGTMIGMHLKRVAVPLRLSVKTIGKASLAAARVRPPFAGGARAVYNGDLL